MGISVKLMLSAAGVLALSAGRALALSPADIATAAGNGTLVTLYVSGSTATDTVLENLFKLDDAAYRLCMPGSLDIYYYKSISGAISQRALTCTAAFTSGSYITTGTTRIAVLKESAGESINGIVNVADATALPFINLVSGNLTTACNAVSAIGATLPTGTGNYNLRDCGHVNGSTASTVSLANFAPKAGISEVEPALFVGTGGVTTSHDNAITRKRAALAVTLNPTVSVPLFTVLQRAYGYIGDTASEDATSVDKVPSLPSGMLRAIFNGASVLAANEMNVNGVKLSTRLSGFADSSGDIYICRRGDTSGTMVSFKAHFLNQGCSRNVANNMTFVNPDSNSCKSSGCSWGSAHYADYVFAGSTAEDVRNCMDYNSSQGRMAVGIDTTDSKPDTAGHRYRYIKLDGAEPTLKAVMEGRYRAFVESTFNDKWISTAVASADQALWDAIYSRIGNRSVLVAANGNWRDAVAIGVAGAGEGDTGLLAVPSSDNYPTYPVTAASVRVNSVNSQTRKTLGGVANSCNRSYQAYP